jgi:CHAD domain-containing protein
MSYRLTIQETVPAGIKRIALEQIDQALAHMIGSSDGLDCAVHNVRTCLKKLRAVLRLVRDELGEEMYRRENTLYRDMGRQLSAVWHSAARLRTLDELVEQCNDRSLVNIAASTREQLTWEHITTVRELLDSQLMAEIAATLREARMHIDTWPIERDGFSTLMVGLLRVYKRGRKRHAIALARFTDKDMHELRKQVRYLWYHLCILRPCWSYELRELATLLRDLSDILRDDRDLAELRSILDDDSVALMGLVDGRRRELRPVLQSLGHQAYAREPALFAGYVADHWRTWRQH